MRQAANPSVPDREQVLGQFGPLQVAPPVVMLTDPHGRAAEAMRALRTQIQSQHLQEGRRGLAICEAEPQSGCTFVAMNLAVALSQIGVDTLLVEANLRDPRLAQLIERDTGTGGLRECLARDGANASDFIEDDVLPGLSILYAGGVAPDAQELLARERFEAMINTCLRTYDATIIDTPPANSSADTLRISNVVGYSLIVTRKNQSLVSDVRTLIGQLQDARATVVGTVLDAS